MRTLELVFAVILLLFTAGLIDWLIALMFEGWRSEHPKRLLQPTPMRIVTGDIERIDSHKQCRQEKADSASREGVLLSENNSLRELFKQANNFSIEFRRRMEQYKALYEATSCELTAVRAELTDVQSRPCVRKPIP